MKFQNLLQIIKGAQKNHTGFSLRMQEAEALGRWDIAVGEQIAKHAKAVRVHESILWVEVEHPIWRAELHYRKKQILDILNGITPCARPALSAPKEILKDICYLDPKPTRKPFFRQKR
ncbi:MAG: DUF721 domain-containing protein [Bdellovibrio sp.]|nr:DUF721 domain-containing protein [Bdellovibrio sp.]